MLQFPFATIAWLLSASISSHRIANAQALCDLIIESLIFSHLSHNYTSHKSMCAGAHLIIIIVSIVVICRTTHAHQHVALHRSAAHRAVSNRIDNRGETLVAANVCTRRQNWLGRGLVEAHTALDRRCIRITINTLGISGDGPSFVSAWCERLELRGNLDSIAAMRSMRWT